MNTAAFLKEVDEHFKVPVARSNEQLLENIKSSLARPHMSLSGGKAVTEPLHVLAGGPSLQDTIRWVKGGYIATMNGSLGYVKSRGFGNVSCAVLDPRPHMADEVEAHDDVTYFLASMVHPRLWEKLLAKHCQIVLWHAGPEGFYQHLLDDEEAPVIVRGGSTMGLRWIDLGGVLGFRKFHLHGFDSSFEPTGSSYRTHAYSHPADRASNVVSVVDGFPTSMNFLQQAKDFFDRYPKWVEAGIDLTVHGWGLLQHLIKESPEHASLLANP